MKTISVELVKARITELQSDIDQVKSRLQSVKESAAGRKVEAEDIQKVEELTRELLTLKAGQSELIALLS